MASSKGIRAGRAFVELFADSNALYRALDKAAARLKAFGTQSMSIGAKIGAAGGVLAAPFAKFFSDAASKGNAIKDIATRFGASTDAVSGLAGAFSVAGSDLGEFAGSLDALQSKIKSAADAGGLFDEQLVSIGRARDLEKLSLPQQFDRLADALGRIPDATHRALKAQEMFGAAGAKLLPFLKDGAAGLARLKAEAVKAGEIMSGEDIERSAAVWKSLNRIWLEAKNTMINIGAAILPTAEQTAYLREQVQGAFAATRDWVGANKGLIVGAAKIAGGLVAAGAAVTGIGATISVAAPIITAAVGGAKLLGAAFMALTNPVGLVALGIGGLGALFATQTKAGREMCARIGAGFSEFADTAKSAWGGIVAAIGNGDIMGAVEIAGAGLQLEWEKVMAYWTEQWVKFRDGFLADLAKIGERIQGTLVWQTGVEAKGMIESGMDKLVDSLSGWAREAAPVANMMSDSVRDLEALAAQHTGSAPAAPAADAPAKGPDPAVTARLARVAAAQERFNALVAQAKEPGTGRAVGFGGGGDFDGDSGGVGRGAFGAIAKLGVGLQGLKEKIAAGALTAQQLGNRSKGIFSGPVAQTLAIGDTVAKRQLDAAVAQAKDVKELLKEQKGIREDNKKVLGLVQWN